MLGNFTYCNPTRLHFGEQALEQLATVADGEQTDMDDFLKALQGGGEE